MRVMIRVHVLSLVPVAATVENAVPVTRDVVAEGCEGFVVGRHRVVAEDPPCHLPEPSSDPGIGWCLRRFNASLTSLSFASSRSRRVFRLMRKALLRDLVLMKVKSRKLKVSVFKAAPFAVGRCLAAELDDASPFCY